MKNKFMTLCLAVLILTACGTKKHLSDGMSASEPGAIMDLALEDPSQLYIHQIHDNRVTADNIVASLSFTIKSGSKTMSAPGTLRMRRNEIVRLQFTVPILGSEVARIDFTPTHVLLVDRLHKEYLKASYSDLHFLRDNGIDFYALQSLFWNQLYSPDPMALFSKGVKGVAVDMDNSVISLTRDKMAYTWVIDPSVSHVQQADVRYRGTQGATSSLQWKYANFQDFIGTSFPLQHRILFSTDATSKPRQVDVTMQLSGLSDNSKWDLETNLSGKYKEMDAEALLSKMLNVGN